MTLTDGVGWPSSSHNPANPGKFFARADWLLKGLCQLAERIDACRLGQTAVLLNHLGYETDLALAKVPDFAAIIGGHAHTVTKPISPDLEWCEAQLWSICW